MKKIGLLTLLSLCCLLVFAQNPRRLFLVDDYHGNYKEIALDREVTFGINNQTQQVSGKLAVIAEDKIEVMTQSGQVSLALDQLTSVVLNEKSVSPGSSFARGVKYFFGYTFLIQGVPTAIIGLAYAFQEPGVGIVTLAIGAGLSIGGYLLIRSANNSGKTVRASEAISLRESRYRLEIR